MKTITCLMILLSLAGSVNSQVIIKGRITGSDGLSLPGANVSLQETYDGASTDTAGYFSFNTTETGKHLLVVSFVGYKTVEKEIDLSSDLAAVEIVLTPQAGEIISAIVTAGAFETGDLKRPIVLKPMDIATTPSAMGDIYGALNTLPGTQMVGNEGGLYVRGGEGYETKTYIDGMQVVSPYQAKMPDLPTRSRFSPILFKGTVFSTGGYSAEYGEALSSAINLNTIGLADKTQSGATAMSVGMNGSHSQRWERGSVSGTIQYLNMTPYYRVFKTSMDWEKAPEQTDGSVLFRQQYGRYGLLKIFGTFNINKSTLNYSETGYPESASIIAMQNNNYYLNAVYNDVLSKKWKYKAGFAATYDHTGTGINTDKLDETVRAWHQRLTFTHDYNENISVKMGEEGSWYDYDQGYRVAATEQNYTWNIRTGDYAVYAEPEVRLNERYVFRAGLRNEYVSMLHEWSLMPRLSLACKLNDYSQFSLAYGLFRQRPEKEYLIWNHDLQSEKATHLILNYQYEIENRIFRVELYKKWYNNLVKYASENNPCPSAYNNAGSGSAKGIDLFWRDSKTIRDLDYWVSYSYIQTKRNYRNYQKPLVPSFISPHSLSVVMKYFIRRANIYTGLTYMYASPKTWYNPALAATKGDPTLPFNDLSMNILVIRPFLKSYCGILFNVSNVLGFNNVFGYHYAAAPDETGNYEQYPIKPQSKRFFILGLFINL
jgi:hypothetical protein